MRLAILLIVGSALSLVACNSVNKEDLPTALADPKFVEISKRLAEDDRRLLAGYMFRRTMANSFGSGQGLQDGAKNVGEALDAQRKWLANQTDSQQRAELLKVEVETKRKIIANEIAKTITVAFLNAKFIPSDFQSGRYEDYESLSFAVQNLGSKSLKALKGQAVFTDTFGEEFLRVPMHFEESVKPSEKKEIELRSEINKFAESSKKVMQLDSSKKFRFEPEQIVYDDGSTLKAPPQPE